MGYDLLSLLRLILIEYLDAEPVKRCLSCGWRGYLPLPIRPEAQSCYYCHERVVPGMGSCTTCQEKMRNYRILHPKKRRKIGAVLPVVQEVNGR